MFWRNRHYAIADVAGSEVAPRWNSITDAVYLCLVDGRRVRVDEATALPFGRSRSVDRAAASINFAVRRYHDGT